MRDHSQTIYVDGDPKRSQTVISEHG